MGWCTFKRAVAVAIVTSLLVTSSHLSEAALYSPQLLSQPEFLPQFDLVPPPSLGRVTDYYDSSGLRAQCSDSDKADRARSGSTNSPFRAESRDPELRALVVLIQDLHANYGAQRNIARILDFLATKLETRDRAGLGAQNSDSDQADRALSPEPGAPFVVAVEGAEGVVDESVMALFPGEKQAALDYLMREGMVSGAEYFAAMRRAPRLLFGVEDGRYYNMHLQLFRQTLAARQRLAQILTGIQADLEALKPRIFSRGVRDFQNALAKLEQGRMSLEEYVSFLTERARHHRVDLKTGFPSLDAFGRGLTDTRSDTPNLQQLQRDTQVFLRSVHVALSAEERARLTQLAARPDHGPYYLYMRELIHQRRLFLAVPPELARYLEYLHAVQTVGADKLLQEGQALAQRIMSHLAQSQVERDLLQAERDLGLLLRMTELKATESEVRAFAPRLNEFLALSKSLLASYRVASFDESGLRHAIAAGIDFYVMALARNKPLAERTLNLLRAPGSGLRQEPGADRAPSPQPRAVVLVAGGFHTAALAQQFREQNVSYVVISPNVPSHTEADHELYVKRLKGVALSAEEVWEEVSNGFGRRAGEMKSAQQSASSIALMAGIGKAPFAMIETYRSLKQGENIESIRARLLGRESHPASREVLRQAIESAYSVYRRRNAAQPVPIDTYTAGYQELQRLYAAGKMPRPHEPIVYERGAVKLTQNEVDWIRSKFSKRYERAQLALRPVAFARSHPGTDDQRRIRARAALRISVATWLSGLATAVITGLAAFNLLLCVPGTPEFFVISTWPDRALVLSVPALAGVLVGFFAGRSANDYFHERHNMREHQKAVEGRRYRPSFLTYETRDWQDSQFLYGNIKAVLRQHYEEVRAGFRPAVANWFAFPVDTFTPYWSDVFYAAGVPRNILNGVVACATRYIEAAVRAGLSRSTDDPRAFAQGAIDYLDSHDPIRQLRDFVQRVRGGRTTVRWNDVGSTVADQLGYDAEFGSLYDRLVRESRDRIGPNGPSLEEAFLAAADEHIHRHSDEQRAKSPAQANAEEDNTVPRWSVQTPEALDVVWRYCSDAATGTVNMLVLPGNLVRHEFDLKSMYSVDDEGWDSFVGTYTDIYERALAMRRRYGLPISGFADDMAFSMLEVLAGSNDSEGISTRAVEFLNLLNEMNDALNAIINGSGVPGDRLAAYYWAQQYQSLQDIIWQAGGIVYGFVSLQPSVVLQHLKEALVNIWLGDLGERWLAKRASASSQSWSPDKILEQYYQACQVDNPVVPLMDPNVLAQSRALFERIYPVDSTKAWQAVLQSHRQVYDEVTQLYADSIVTSQDRAKFCEVILDSMRRGALTRPDTYREWQRVFRFLAERIRYWRGQGVAGRMLLGAIVAGGVAGLALAVAVVYYGGLTGVLIVSALARVVAQRLVRKAGTQPLGDELSEKEKTLIELLISPWYERAWAIKGLFRMRFLNWLMSPARFWGEHPGSREGISVDMGQWYRGMRRQPSQILATSPVSIDGTPVRSVVPFTRRMPVPLGLNWTSAGWWRAVWISLMVGGVIAGGLWTLLSPAPVDAIYGFLFHRTVPWWEYAAGFLLALSASETLIHELANAANRLVRRFNPNFDAALTQMPSEEDRSWKIESDFSALFKNWRPRQAAQVLFGTVWNLLFNQKGAHARLEATQKAVNGWLAGLGTRNPYRVKQIEIRDIKEAAQIKGLSWWRRLWLLLWWFHAARVARHPEDPEREIVYLNPHLPRRARSEAIIHELNHVPDPDASEAVIMKRTEQMMSEWDQYRDHPEVFSKAALDRQAAERGVTVKDINDLLKNLAAANNLSPQETQNLGSLAHALLTAA